MNLFAWLLLLAAPADTVERLPIEKTAAGTWTFVRTACDKKTEACAVSVELHNTIGKTSRVRLEWPAYASGFQIQKDATGILLSAGEEASALEERLIPVRLDKQTEGLLVTQVRGHEWIHRNHELLAVVGGELIRVWSLSDPTSGFPGFWSTQAQKTKDGRHEIIAEYWAMTTADASTDPPEDWNLAVVRWDEKTKRARQLNAKEAGLAVWAVIIGSFKSVAEAKSYKSKVNPSCTVSGWNVLATDSFQKLTPGLFVVMRTFLQRKEAEQTVKALSDCDGVNGYLKRAL